MMPSGDSNVELNEHDTTSSRGFQVSSQLELSFVDHRFIISSDKSSIEIDRFSGAVKACNDSGKLTGTKISIFGVLGIIELIRGPYLIVITDREEIGQLDGHQIFRVKGTRIFPFRDFVNPTEKQKEDEKVYLEMINSVLSLPFYFSYTTDITNTLQRIHDMSEDALNKPLYKRVDSRFFWNHYMLQSFINSEDDISEFILPVMMGHIGIYDLEVEKNKVQFSIISRRNIHRPGTRYQIRGIDQNGNVANNVETEHILIYNGKKSAFTQIRGSIPVIWSQYPTLKYAPKIVVSKDDKKNCEAFKKHFEKLHDIYKGNIVCANLADQKGREKEIVSKYHELKDATELSCVKYFPFDFHSECKGMRYENISRLLEAIQEELDTMGWFDGSGKIQKGTLRSNCIDNLDRTNVVQSVFSKYVLRRQLESFGVEDVFGFFKQMETTINHAWADNADALSNQYASAPAMKTDYTRNGIRTKFGAFMDGVYSVQRYINNNFYDGVKTDAFNLFLGNYRVKPEVPSPLPNKKEFEKVQSLAFLLFIIISVVLGSPLTNHWFNFFVSFGLVIGGMTFYIKKNALKLVNNPILVEDKKKWD